MYTKYWNCFNPTSIYLFKVVIQAYEKKEKKNTVSDYSKANIKPGGGGARL